MNIDDHGPAPTGPTTPTAAPQAHVSRQDLRVLKALRQSNRAIDLHSRRLLGTHAITSPQLITLITIAGDDPTTATAIAGEIHLSPSTVVGIVDRLEAKRLIRRFRDTSDRRRVLVSLTEAGREVAGSAPSPLQTRLADAMSRLKESSSKRSRSRWNALSR